MYTDPWRWPCGWPDKAGLQAGARSVKLHEFQAKRIFAEGGIPVPKSKVADTPQEAERPPAAGWPRRGEGAGPCCGAARGRHQARGRPGRPRTKAEQILGTPQGPQGQSTCSSSRRSISSRSTTSASPLTGPPSVRSSSPPRGVIDIEQVPRETPEKSRQDLHRPAYGLLVFESRRIAYGAGFDPALGARWRASRQARSVFARTDASSARSTPSCDRGRSLWRRRKLPSTTTPCSPAGVEALREIDQEDPSSGGVERGIPTCSTTVRSASSATARDGNGDPGHGDRWGRQARHSSTSGRRQSRHVRNSSTHHAQPKLKGTHQHLRGITRGDEVANGIIEAINT